MSATHTLGETNHSPENESHTSRRAEDHTLRSCDSYLSVRMTSEELILKDEATTSSEEILSSVINDKSSLSTSSLLTTDKHHETQTTITTTATACAITTATMETLITSDTSTRTQEATISPATTDYTDRHGGMLPVLQMEEMETAGEGQTQGEREESPLQLFPDTGDFDVPEGSPDVVLGVQEPQILPQKIVLLIDRQDAYLKSFSYSNVYQIYNPKLNFGNAFDIIKNGVPAFQKNTLFLMLCGTMSALKQVINEKCFLLQCKEPLYNYTLQEFKAQNLDEFLISEAKILRKKIMEMNNCNVIFTGLLPIKINCAETHEAAKHYTQTGHQVKLASSRHDALYAQLCSGLREFNKWAKTDAASKGFPHWSLVDMLTTSDATDSTQHFKHPTQADGVTLTGECMVQRRMAIRVKLCETFLRTRRKSQSLEPPCATADDEEVKVVAVVPKQCSYKPENIMQASGTELAEVVLLADQIYRIHLKTFTMKRMCLITEVNLSPEKIAKIVQKYYYEVPKNKKMTWILCLGIYNFVEIENNHDCVIKKCKKKLKGIVDKNTKGHFYQKIQSALSTINNFKSALEKALPKNATIMLAPPLPSVLAETGSFEANHTKLHVIALRHHMFLCSSLSYCIIRRFYMQVFDLWVNTVMKLEGGRCAELMNSYINVCKDKSLSLVSANHSNKHINTLRKCGKEWKDMIRNVISANLTSTNVVTGHKGLQWSLYLSNLPNVIHLEVLQSRGKILTFSLLDKPDKTDYNFKQVVVVGNQMPPELEELCQSLSIHVVPERMTFDEAGKALLYKCKKFWPCNTLWVILTDLLHLTTAKPIPACKKVKCRAPIPFFGTDVPSMRGTTNWKSYIKVKIDIFIAKVQAYFQSLIEKFGEESAVFLPPVTPILLMRPTLHENHQTLHAMYDSCGKMAMVCGKPAKWMQTFSLLKKAWLEMLEPFLEHYSVPKRILQLYSTSDPNQDWIKTLGKLLVHFTASTNTNESIPTNIKESTLSNIDECEAVFSDAEFSSGEEDMMEYTEGMVATTAVPTCSLQARSVSPTQTQTQAAVGWGMQHEPERTPRKQQNKEPVRWSVAQKQEQAKQKEQQSHKTNRDHTTSITKERQEEKTGKNEALQGNQKGQKASKKEKSQVSPRLKKRQWHDEIDKSLQPPRKKIFKETAKQKEGKQLVMIEKGKESRGKKAGKANAKQGKVQKTSKQGKKINASKQIKCVKPSRQKKGEQTSKQDRKTPKQRIFKEISEPGRNTKAAGQKIPIQEKCHVITQMEKDKGTPMDGKDQENSIEGNDQVTIKMKKVLKSPTSKRGQVTAKVERCPEIQESEETEQLEVTKMEDQIIVKTEQCEDIIKSEEFEDTGSSKGVLWYATKIEGGDGDIHLSHPENGACLILAQTDENKDIKSPERDHLSNDFEDTTAALGTPALSQTLIPNTEGPLTEPGNSSTALTEEPKTGQCEDDTDDTLAGDMEVSDIKPSVEESYCEQNVDERSSKEDSEESGSKQNTEQRILRKDMDGSGLKENTEDKHLTQNTEQQGPSHDVVRESDAREDTENTHPQPPIKEETKQTSPKQNTEESHSGEHLETQSYKTNRDENIPSQRNTTADTEVASIPDSIETEALDADGMEQEYIFNLSNDSDILEWEEKGGAGGKDMDIRTTKEVVMSAPGDIKTEEVGEETEEVGEETEEVGKETEEVREATKETKEVGEATKETEEVGEGEESEEVGEDTEDGAEESEGEAEEVMSLSCWKRKLSSFGQDSPDSPCSSDCSSSDSDQEMKVVFSMLEESINQTYQLNLQTFMQVPEVHSDYEAKQAEFLESYEKQHGGKQHDEEHQEKAWGEFWEDTVKKQLYEDWVKNKKELVEQFKVLERNSSGKNSSREDQSKQVKKDESNKENQVFQNYGSNPPPLLSSYQKQNELSPLSENRFPKTSFIHNNDFESYNTDVVQCWQLLSKINTGTTNIEVKQQTLQLDMSKVMANDTKKRMHLILSSFTLLSEHGRSLGSLAPAVVPIIKAVLEKGAYSEEALSILAKKDNVELFKKCIEKLMLLSEKAIGEYKSKLLKCAKATIELLENVTMSMKTVKVVRGMDIPSIAKATARQDMTHVLQFIRDTLSSKGVHNPSRSMLNELFLAVSSEHFNLAIQSQPPASPDTSK